MNLIEIPGPRGRKRFVTREAYKRMNDRGELPIPLDFLLWEPESGRRARARFQADIERVHNMAAELMGIPVRGIVGDKGYLLQHGDGAIQIQGEIVSACTKT